MKVNKLKVIGMIGAVALIFASCGKSTVTDPRASTPTTAAGSCDPNATGDYVFTGDIQNCQDTNSCVYGQVPLTGSVVLTVIPTGGQMAGQFTASALLTVNGSSFCCTSQGASGILGGGWSDVEATISGLPLICQGTTGASGGLFSGGYNNMAIKIGVPFPYSYDGYSVNSVALITTAKRLEGYIQIVSGNVVGSANSLPFFVQ